MSVRTKLIALSAALAAALVMLGLRGMDMWNRAKAERKANVNVPVRYVAPPPIPAMQRPEATQSVKYADVAAKDLMSKDRNPNVAIEPPKVEPPKVMPALPVVSGVMMLPSGARAMMAEKAGSPVKGLKVGETIGEFTIAALDRKTVTFLWNDKKIEKNLDELIDRTSIPQNSSGAYNTGSGSAGSALQTLQAPALGNDLNDSETPAKGCVPGDNSPAGTILDGYKKVGTMTPFGLMGCRWVQEK